MTLLRYPRIARRPNRTKGIPYLRGSNIRVDSIVHLRAHASEDAILNAFPELDREDVRQAVAFAAETVTKLSPEVAVRIKDGKGRKRRIRRAISDS